MRRLLRKLVGLLVLFSAPSLADPLSNLGQVFPFVGFLFGIPCALLTWSLAYRGPNGSHGFAAWRTALIALAVLSVLAVMGAGPSAALFLLGVGLVGLVAASPFLCLWCVPWWFTASRAYRNFHAPPLAIAVAGIGLMIGLSCAVIWAVFPNECRHMFRLM